MKALAHFMVKRVFGSDRIITGTIENYKSESEIQLRTDSSVVL